ncbi:MAG: hypothetical protein ACR2FH_07550, partial [Caulobacteraceae bacterium]
YEELAADPAAVSAATARFLGLQGPPIEDARFLSSPLEVQATDLNSRWEARFREEKAEFCTTRGASAA